MTDSPDSSPQINLAQLVVRMGVLLLISAVALFGAAGRFDWPMAWLYIAFVVAFTFASRLQMLRVNPDLAAERADSLNKDDVKPWDRTLMPIVAIWGPLLTLVVAGLDARNGWSGPVAIWVQVAAFAVLVFGYWLGHWATMTNRFFSGTVRIQTERGHAVVDTGPYRSVRHPGYAGGLLAGFAAPIMLGSLWGLVPALGLAAALFARTALEDRTLQAELPGYAEYAQRVRARLIPGVW